MKLASWNVNGIRACVKKGFRDWLISPENEVVADIICLQETKADPEQIHSVIGDLEQFEQHYASAEKKGYSGVATLIHKNVNSVGTTIRLGVEKFDSEGRTLITELENFFLFNCYFPNGQRDHGRVPYKLDYSNCVLEKAKQLERETGKPSIICGDFNTAHQEILNLCNDCSQLCKTDPLHVRLA